MCGYRAKLLVYAAAGLLVAMAAGRACAAVKFGGPVRTESCLEFDPALGTDGDEVTRYLSEVLKSHGAHVTRGLLVCLEGTIELSPLFPPSSGPGEQREDPEIKYLSVPLPGAGAIPPSINGTGAGPGVQALAREESLNSHASLQTALPPEANDTLPADPPFRWFRPPRHISSGARVYFLADSSFELRKLKNVN